MEKEKTRERTYASPSPCVSCEKDGNCNDEQCKVFVEWFREKWMPQERWEDSE